MFPTLQYHAITQQPWLLPARHSVLCVLDTVHVTSDRSVIWFVHGCAVSTWPCNKTVSCHCLIILLAFDMLVFISSNRCGCLDGGLLLMLLRLLSRHLSRVIWTSAIRCCMVCQRTCCGRYSLYRTLLLVFSPAHGPVATSLQCCINYIGCWCRDEWNLRLHVNHTPYIHKLNFHSSLHRQPM